MASLVDPRFKTTYIKEERVDYMMAKAAEELESLLKMSQRFLLRSKRRV